MSKDPRVFKKVLITGITGSGGSYLAEHLLEKHEGVAIHGIYRKFREDPLTNVQGILDQIHLHEADLLDQDAVARALNEAAPDVVFHLASDADVRRSFDEPGDVLNNNIVGTSNLFEAIRQSDLDPVVQLCSTSEVYGQVGPEDVPINENCAIRPASPYAISKVAQDMLGRLYWASFEMKVIRTRMFTYFNPRRPNLFATSFARQVARIEAGLQQELTHGNLESVRTFLDVRDAMEAYWMAVLHGQPGEVYNIGGTCTMSVGEFLEVLKSLARTEIPTRQDPSLLRPVDVTLQIPDTRKFFALTGWAPKIPFEESVKHLLNEWRVRVQEEQSTQGRSF